MDDALVMHCPNKMGLWDLFQQIESKSAYIFIFHSNNSKRGTILFLRLVFSCHSDEQVKEFLYLIKATTEPSVSSATFFRNKLSDSKRLKESKLTDQKKKVSFCEWKMIQTFNEPLESLKITYIFNGFLF